MEELSFDRISNSGRWNGDWGGQLEITDEIQHAAAAGFKGKEALIMLDSFAVGGEKCRALTSGQWTEDSGRWTERTEVVAI